MIRSHSKIEKKSFNLILKDFSKKKKKTEKNDYFYKYIIGIHHPTPHSHLQSFSFQSLLFLFAAFCVKEEKKRTAPFLSVRHLICVFSFWFGCMFGFQRLKQPFPLKLLIFLSLSPLHGRVFSSCCLRTLCVFFC